MGECRAGRPACMQAARAEIGMTARVRGQRKKVSLAALALENLVDKAELGFAVLEVGAIHMVSVLQAEHGEIGELAERAQSQIQVEVLGFAAARWAKAGLFWSSC